MTGATTAMNLAILHENARMLRNWHLTMTPRLVTHVLREKNVSLVGSNVITMLHSNSAIRIIKQRVKRMSSMTLKWIT